MLRIVVAMTVGLAVVLTDLSVPAPVPASVDQAAATTTIVGTWKVTYGAPAVMTIRSSGSDEYTMIAKSPVTVTGSTCQLPAGTTISRFSGTGRTYSGRHGLWNVSDCSFISWTSLNITVTGSQAVEEIGDGETHTLTKVDSTGSTAGNGWDWLWIWLLLLLVILVVIAVIVIFVIRRRRRRPDNSDYRAPA